MAIVLKDRNDANVTFHGAGSSANTRVFLTASSGGTLLGRNRLTLSITEGPNVNRVRFKIEAPHICEPEQACAASVTYTLVASGDVSVVKFSTEADRKDLAAFVSSLTGTSSWEEMVVNGVLPSL